jgi:hypothetical protein
MPATQSPVQQKFKEAFEAKKKIVYTPKGTEYKITHIGIFKDKATDTWLECVSYTDGEQVFTRLSDEMSDFTIGESESSAASPSFLTAVFQINHDSNFAGVLEMLNTSSNDFDPKNEGAWGVVAMKDGNHLS